MYCNIVFYKLHALLAKHASISRNNLFEPREILWHEKITV